MAERHPLQGVWISEVAYHPDDPHCGAGIRQLTSQTTLATNIYCEDPNCSAECGRMVVLRSHYTDHRAPGEVWVVDPGAGRSVLVEADAAMVGMAQAAYGDFFFYFRGSADSRELVRLCLSTLEVEPVWTRPPDHPRLIGLGSMTPDNRFYVNRIIRSAEQHAVVVLDLETASETIIAEGHDLFNPHPRFDRMKGENVLIQWNRGQRWSEAGGVETYDPDAGITLFVVRRDGTDRRELPIAHPHTPMSISGHETWVTGRPEFVFSSRVGLPFLEDGGRVGNMLHYRLGEERPRVLAHDPDTYYGHVSTSRCGRFWVADGWERDRACCCEPPWIAVGSLTSGKFAKLCDVGGHWARYEHAHAHPYMTADNRSVVFGSLRTGTAQVFAADIPEGFLEALE